MKLKPGVKVRGISPELVLAAFVVDSILSKHNNDHTVLTSVADGSHRYGSLHFTGDAFDVRVHNLPSDLSLRQELITLIREALSDEFDVIYEGHETSNAHIHVEFQPKRL